MFKSIEQLDREDETRVIEVWNFSKKEWTELLPNDTDYRLLRAVHSNGYRTHAKLVRAVTGNVEWVENLIAIVLAEGLLARSGNGSREKPFLYTFGPHARARYA